MLMHVIEIIHVHTLTPHSPPQYPSGQEISNFKFTLIKDFNVIKVREEVFQM